MGRRAAADRIRMGGRVRCPRHPPDDRARVAMDAFILRPVSGLSPVRRRGGRIQRQVHGRPDGAARRQQRNAARARAGDLPQLLSAGRALAVLGAAPRQGCVHMLTRTLKDIGDARDPLASEPPPDAARAAFAQDLMHALASRPRSISPKYFYDDEGSRLFDLICELPEYYPTRTELGILSRHAGEIAAHMGPRAEIVEFGAGSLRKVRLLLRAMDRPARYVPIDISGEHLARAAAALQREQPGLPVYPVVADYTAPLRLPMPLPAAGQRVGFFPGSTIGNFTPDEAL